ncbi:MAG: hypothetical protein ACRBM6_38615 [Geminicoccales bacterium]
MKLYPIERFGFRLWIAVSVIWASVFVLLGLLDASSSSKSIARLETEIAETLHLLKKSPNELSRSQLSTESASKLIASKNMINKNLVEKRTYLNNRKKGRYSGLKGFIGLALAVPMLLLALGAMLAWPFRALRASPPM